MIYLKEDGKMMVYLLVIEKGADWDVKMFSSKDDRDRVLNAISNKFHFECYYKGDDYGHYGNRETFHFNVTTEDFSLPDKMTDAERENWIKEYLVSITEWNDKYFKHDVRDCNDKYSL